MDAVIPPFDHMQQLLGVRLPLLFRSIQTLAVYWLRQLALNASRLRLRYREERKRRRECRRPKVLDIPANAGFGAA
jgi:hypothetical protein